MKRSWKLALNTAIIAAVLTTTNSHAETLNIPFADGVSISFGECYGESYLGWIPKDPYNTANAFGCRVQFAIPVAPGHTIQQISVLYGAYSPVAWGGIDPQIISVGAAMDAKPISGPNSGINSEHFLWYKGPSADWLNLNYLVGTVYAQPLMKKFDAFVVDQDTLYTAWVEVHNFAFIAGLQVTYN